MEQSFLPHLNAGLADLKQQTQDLWKPGYFVTSWTERDSGWGGERQKMTRAIKKRKGTVTGKGQE